jgi:DNA-binding CsgD family transcriptional regulator
MRPITTFVRPLTDPERQQLRVGLRSADAFTLRRSQILLASVEGQSPARIAAHLGCTAATVRNAIHAFAALGPACLKEKSSRPHRVRFLLDPAFDEPLRQLLHQSPRVLGQPRSTWTLALLARVCHEKGWTERVMSIETVRAAVRRLGHGGKRAKHGITSPDPAYARKKNPATG